MTDGGHTGPHTAGFSDGSLELTRAQRLDRLPFTDAHGKLVLGSGVGWALDAMDVGLISFVIAALAVAVGAGRTRQAGVDRLDRASSAWRSGATLGRAARRPHRPPAGLRPHPAGLRPRDGRLRAGLVGLACCSSCASSSGSASAPSCRSRRRWSASSHRPASAGALVVVLEAFWAVGWTAGRPHRLPGDPGGRQRVALGARDRRRARPLYAVVVRCGPARVGRGSSSPGRPPRPRPSCASRPTAAHRGPPASPRSTRRRSGRRAPRSPPRGRADSRRAWRPAGPRPARGRRRCGWSGSAVNFSYYGAFIWLPTMLLVGRGSPSSARSGTR